jgi:hypothetical protein
LVAANQTFGQDIAALKVDSQQCHCTQELSALNATASAGTTAGAANAAAIAAVNASVASLASAEVQRAAAVATLGASVATLNTTVAAIDLGLYFKKTDAIDAATLGSVAAALYLRKRVVPYSYQTRTTGAFGGRAAGDTLCQAATTRPSGLLQARAFVSVDASDAITGFPAKYGVPINLPIESPGSVVVAGNWTQLLGGSIRVTLNDAGVAGGLWYSGSNSDGSARSSNCNGWTSSNPADVGATGDCLQTNTRWLDSLTPVTCNSNNVLLCIAF